MERGRCKSCRREILWVVMMGGSRMPLDPEPTPDGNVYQDTDLRWRVAGNAAAAAKHDPTYQTHFRTCPQAAQHRQPRARKAPPPADTLELTLSEAPAPRRRRG